MNPRLVVITGSLSGRVFTLNGDELSIGRDPTNLLSLPDPSVSRHHCVIKREAEQYHVVDMDSYNGTLVNGLQIQRQLLCHGAQIAVGNILLLFLSEDDSDSAMQPVQFDDRELVAGTTIRLQGEDALYLNHERVETSLSPIARISHDLSTLLKISTIVNSTRSLLRIQQLLLREVFEAIPAEYGAILLSGKSLSETVSVIGYDKAAGKERPIIVSKTITDQVQRERVAIVSNDVARSESFGAADSLVASKTRSLLCVPIEIFGGVIGAIYLGAGEPDVQFDEGHLQLMVAISGIAAVAIENASHIEWLENENQQLHTEVKLKHNMIGDSECMHKLYKFIAQVAPTNATVLIQGESGTGKELAAYAIHLNSPRFNKPFAAINCAAFPETLIESEFFGYEKGAFNEAKAQKKGLLEVSHCGTVFLDEVGELAPTVQAKLLRVLEKGEFRRVGGTNLVKVDVRFIAATNRNLKQGIEQKTFRDDLYHRLNVFPLNMPPLRERGKDILLLTNHFIFEYNKKHNRPIVGITPDAVDSLRNYSWPGNVRELKNVIERAVIISNTQILTKELFTELPSGKPTEISTTKKLKSVVEAARKQAIISAFRQTGGKHAEAAKVLGVHPIHLHRLIRTLGIKSDLGGDNG